MLRITLCCLLALSIASASAVAEQSTAETYEAMVSKAVGFLQTKGQAEDGSYSGFAGVGPTAIIATGILRHGRNPDDPFVAKSIEYVKKHIRDDGGIYTEGSLYRNYETCVAILCLAEANKDGKYDETIKRADAFIKGIQWDEGEDTEKADPAYGGAGYGRHKRPDLSNTTFLIDALKAAGNTTEDEAMQRALAFVSRCQNLESEHNTTEHAAKNPDGGFYDTAAAGGESQAGETANGGLRSYASMTYAGLKSMIYAGVGPEDPRVKAAYTWAQKHYGLADNPGMGAQGLYYYYHTFAKALDAVGKDKIVDGDGQEHDWRAELIAELAKRQQDDGSWINSDSDRWLEGDPNLVTGYALLALSYCKPKSE